MISIRIYKGIPQGKIVVNFSYDLNEVLPKICQFWEHKRSNSIILKKGFFKTFN